jgi:hypothetical protein
MIALPRRQWPVGSIANIAPTAKIATVTNHAH